ISLLEFLDDRAGNVPIKFFASDISEEAIERGRRGVYLENSSQDVSPERLRRFFIKAPDGYEVAKPVRELCVFAKHDLTKDPPFSNLDLISCRNVLIYFGPVLQKRVIPVFHYSLKPAGFLMLGASEAVGQFSDLFSLQERKHKIHTKKPASAVHAFDFPTRNQTLSEGVALEKQRQLAAKPGATVKKEVDLLLEKYSPAGVVVNQGLKVIQIRGDIGPYLKLAPGEVSVDVLKMAREGLLPPLRKALEEAQRSGQRARKDGLRVGGRTNGDPCEISVEVHPLKAHDGEERCFFVLFESSDERVRDSRTIRGEFRSWLLALLRWRKTGGDATREAAEIERLREELEETKSYLLSVTQEQEATNEELRSANEETLSANEELLSTNEELETAKEELQATNEELSTVNDELQSRNVEMAKINDDLSNLLASVDIPIVMLGSDHCIRRFTPSAAKVLNFIASDVGRPIGDLKPRIDVPDLEALLEEVLEKFCVKEREVKDEEGRWHHLYVRPYRTGEKKIDGAVIALVDIDELKRSEQNLQRLAAVVKDAIDAITVQDLEGRILAWNRGAERMYGYTEAEALGMNIRDIVPEDRKSEAMDLVRMVAKGKDVESFETKRVAKDGTTLDVWLTGTVLTDANGKPERVATTERDITDRLAIERTLREEGKLTGEKLDYSERRTRAILETAAEAIVTIDQTGIVDSCNPATERMFGYGANEIVGKNVKLLMPEPYHSEHGGYIKHYLDTGERKIPAAGREVEGMRKDGSKFPAHLSVSEVRLGQRRLFTGFIRDISELKAAYNRLLQSERLAAIGEAMTGLTHEGRNALQQSQASLEMLARRSTDRPETLELIADIQESQDELHRLYEEVRRYAAPLKLKREGYDLEELVEEVWGELHAMREGRATRLRQDSRGLDLCCELDRALFRRVVRNIFENSLAAKEDDVEVEVHYSEAGSKDEAAICIA
ncbi:MAG: PAS domain S-box protein, partial [Planctomycetota bacterium]